MSWQVEHITKLARQMVYLEWQAKSAEVAHNFDRARLCWSNREDIQFQRSVLMREMWAKERGRETLRETRVSA